MVLARSAMEVPLFAESAKCFLSLSAPLPRDHSCKSRFFSPKKRRVLSAGYSPPDRRELPLCPIPASFPASKVPSPHHFRIICFPPVVLCLFPDEIPKRRQ